MSKKTTRPLKKRKKYADLDPLYMPRVRREFVDYDYVNSLDEESKAWLSKFTSEHYGAAISKTKKKKGGKQRVKPGHLHTKLSQVKEIFDNNNRRNNDVYGVTRINGLLSDISSQPDDAGIADYTKAEQAIIEKIQFEEDLKKVYLEFLATLAVLTPQRLQQLIHLLPKKRRVKK